MLQMAQIRIIRKPLETIFGTWSCLNMWNQLLVSPSKGCFILGTCPPPCNAADGVSWGEEPHATVGESAPSTDFLAIIRTSFLLNWLTTCVLIDLTILLTVKNCCENLFLYMYFIFLLISLFYAIFGPWIKFITYGCEPLSYSSIV